jgi:hypothetical protein
MGCRTAGGKIPVVENWGDRRTYRSGGLSHEAGTAGTAEGHPRTGHIYAGPYQSRVDEAVDALQAQDAAEAHQSAVDAIDRLRENLKENAGLEAQHGKVQVRAIDGSTVTLPAEIRL